MRSGIHQNLIYIPRFRNWKQKYIYWNESRTVKADHPVNWHNLILMKYISTQACSFIGNNNIEYMLQQLGAINIQPNHLHLCNQEKTHQYRLFPALVCMLWQNMEACVHFSGISTCGRTLGETVSHPQHAPLPTLFKISLPVYVIVTNERLQPFTTTWYNSLVLSFSLF